MNEIGTNHTPYIQYITDATSLTIRCDNLTLLNAVPFDYERLFLFINDDLKSFTSDLQNLYEKAFEHFTDFECFVNIITNHLTEIFSISNIVFTRAFIQEDYMEHIRHKMVNATTNTERATIKKLFLQFMANLYKLPATETKPIDDNSLGIFDDRFSKTFFEDVFRTNILPYFQLQGPVPTLITGSEPPYNLLLLQNRIRSYLSWDINRNESYRLRMPSNQTYAENIQLIEQAKNKPSSQHTLSERTAWRLHMSQQAFKNKYPEKSYLDLFPLPKRPRPSQPPYTFDYWKDIKLDFSHVSSCNETAYTFNHVEGILFLDMCRFIQSNHFTFRCPQCRDYCENNRLTFYCNNSCKNKHRNKIIKNCRPWQKAEKMRKKIYARYLNKSYDVHTYQNYSDEISAILNRFFNGEQDATTVLDFLETKDRAIQQEFEKMHETKIYGVHK